jgi:hypothetical protein
VNQTQAPKLPDDTEVQRLTDEIARTKQETADQIARLTKQHDADEYKSHQIRDEALTELRTIKESVARPRIVPVRYGMRSSDGRSGLFVANEGGSAYDITVPDTGFGTSKLVFHYGNIARLVRSDGDYFCETVIQTPRTNLLGEGLIHEMAAQHVDAIELPIRYKDGENRYYTSNCAIERDTRADGGLAIRFLGQESQDLRAAIRQPDSSWVRFVTADPEIAVPKPGAPPANNPQKVRCELLNYTDISYKIRVLNWDSGTRGLNAGVIRQCLQLRIANDWWPKPDGVEELHVPPGESFRMWLYPKDSLSDNLFKEIVRSGNLGTVHFLLNGKEIAVSVG